MNIKFSIRYLKMCLILMKIKVLTLISLVTYLIISVTFIHTVDTNDKIIEILGGFSLNQPPLSIYILTWLIPKLVLFYLIVIFVNCLFQNILPLTILRVKSKSLWFVVINLTVFFTIVLWYITGYLVVLLIASIRNGWQFNITTTYIKMLLLDILATYCITNIFYIILIIINKIVPAITVVLIIYLSTMFANNPNNIIFNILPTNYEMLIRQQYVFKPLLCVCIINIMLVIFCIFFIKRNELLFEGV